MQTSVTSVLERRTRVTSPHDTHPYEVAWALEAIAFIQAEAGHAGLRITPQISPDGINWIDAESATLLSETETLASVRVEHFGSWLRFHIEGAAEDRPAVILLHLALKG